MGLRCRSVPLEKRTDVTLARPSLYRHDSNEFVSKLLEIILVLYIRDTMHMHKLKSQKQ